MTGAAIGPVAIDVSAVPDRPAGAGTYVVALVRALAGLDEVELALVARRDDEERWRRLAPGARVTAVAPTARPFRLAWEQTGALVAARQLGPSVWHGPHYTLPLALTRPRVVTVHDLTFFDDPEWHEASKVAFFTRMIRQSVRRADVVVSVSERTSERLRALLDPAAPVVTAPLGVDHGRFRPAGAGGVDAHGDLARLAELGVRPPFVAFAGTVEPRKNLPGLIRAFSTVAAGMSDLSLVLAGRTGWGATEVAAAVAASPVAGRILQLGYVEADVIPALFRRAAAVAYVPFAEGFGLNALEALACGAALVTSSDTPMADLVGDAACTVPAGDHDALVDALAAVVDGGTEVDRRRSAGPGVAAPWTWERCAATHVEAYHLAAHLAADR